MSVTFWCDPLAINYTMVRSPCLCAQMAESFCDFNESQEVLDDLSLDESSNLDPLYTSSKDQR